MKGSQCQYELCIQYPLLKNKRKQSDTKCLAKNGCAVQAAVSLSRSGRRCPERWLSFYSANVGSMAMTDIFKLAAEKIWITQVRFQDINGRKKFRVRNFRGKEKMVWNGQQNERSLLSYRFVSLHVSHEARLNSHGFPFILQSSPTCPSALLQ